MLWRPLSFWLKSQVAALPRVSFFRTGKDAWNEIMQENEMMKRERPQRPGIGPDWTTESGGASPRISSRFGLPRFSLAFSKPDEFRWRLSVNNWSVSVVTVRRDLDALDQKGLLQRTHGGAVSIEPLFYEPFRHDQSFLAQVERAADEKRRIGRAAAALITAGETIASYSRNHHDRSDP